MLYRLVGTSPARLMLKLRSLLYNFCFYACLVVQMVFWSPFYFAAPRSKAWFVPKFWARTSLAMQDRITGSRREIDGLENLPEGSFILAPKHQSFWDVLAFFPYIQDPLFILKRELMWIPIFGWYVAKMRMIPVNRGNRSKALREVAEATKAEMARNPRQLIIYPEGTRRAPGADPAYKWGIVELYAQMNVPVVPVAHTAGLFWPRRKFLRYPGTIRARFLKPIPPGLDKEEFMRRLVSETEAAVDEILVETSKDTIKPPFPETARKRLADLSKRDSGA